MATAPTPMTARSKARKRALDILFESDLRGADPLTTLADRIERAAPPVAEYSATLVEGVVARRERIDQLISEHATGWTLDRMPAVDRNILRLATFELLWVEDTPDAVVLSEAVGLAQALSTDDSASFVNGLLARLVEEKPRLSV